MSSFIRWLTWLVANFKNADSFHDTSFWGTPNPQKKAYFEVWCNEDGDDGKLPRPDGWRGPWDGKECGEQAWGYSFVRSRWWWFTGVSFESVRWRDT